jgi:monoamine oxidase
MTPDPETTRVCVIGAGAAGLAAAHALVRHGYRTVDVLERDSRVGGKCWTILHDGHTYEVGAGAMTTAYLNVRDLMREHGVRARPKVSGWFAEQGGVRGGFFPPLLRGRGVLSVMPEMARLRRALKRHKRLLEPGIDGMDAELHQPFADWARDERMERVAELLQPWVTGFGYGFFDEVPAGYVLKYLTVARAPFYELLDTGYGGLWQRVASRLDVRTGAEVRKVTRESDRVVVETDAGTREYDALIVACPLDGALTFLEASPEEHGLIERIRYCPYYSVGAIVRNFPRARYMFWEEHLEREAVGQPMFAYRRWPESDLVFFYAFGTGADDGERIEAGVRRVVQRHGGTVERIELSRPWHYFPHVGSAELGAGFQERLEALQGHQRTFYTGEVFSFPIVEAVVAHARNIVDRHFAPPGARPVLCGPGARDARS